MGEEGKRFSKKKKRKKKKENKERRRQRKGRCEEEGLYSEEKEGLGGVGGK